MTSEEEIRILHQLREHPELPAEIAADPHSELAVQQRLRPKYGADLVRAAIGLVEARRKAASLLPSAEELWLTRVGLEQSTAWEVAQHKAKRFPAGSEIRDLCSGIGVDSAALVQQGSLVSFDVDSAMILRCQWNLEVWRNSGVIRGGYGAEHQAADIRSLDVARGLLHIDPDRRGGRERPVKRLEQYC
ncbi:MAG: hypothetical protein KDA89_00150, partial [Planctomycetaceae bacterium]|nr:hypothetical protein [Planctomycetaceae bacterium]